MSEMISLKDVSLSFGQRIIFDNISVTIPKGKITAVMGPSGTGKTTLLKLMTKQILPQSGEITVMGKNLEQLSRNQLFDLRKQMGLLFQSGALFTDMSVFDNVAFALREHTQLSEELINTLVLLKLEAVGLRALKDAKPSSLSGGQARRVALARAIALDPQLLLYDEPFTGQDPISMGVLIRLIKNLNDALDLTSIIVSHDVEEVLSIADYVYILSGGKIIAHGTAEEIKADQNIWVQQFIQGLSDGPVPFNLPTTALKDELLS
ncbi:ABC transporter ATP-binding protein [Wohlfahrtiimonas larvae]|uniref:Phospholipid ABC transporter ATP-binding protein MlaF n=1 Tax=Wohlfahrtiimonas larvae TaxID=1157986 RepID=A0ABP9MMJ6_9GAMM|nr:ATP-binding cassette domain-containing protein [Wohlfahrtiimonas larvae]